MNNNRIINSHNLSHLLIAIIIVSNSLTWKLGFSNSLAYIVIFALSFLFIINKNLFFYHVKNKAILLIVFVYTFFCFSLLKNSFSSITLVYFFQFSVLGAGSIIISQIPINSRLILRYVLIIGVFFIHDSMSLDMSDIMTSGFYNDVYGYLMGKAYGLLPYAISAIILLFFRYNNFLFIILSLLNLMSVSYFIFIFGNRGAAIALLLTPIFFYFIKKNQSNICLFRLFLYLIISVIFLALFVYCFEQFLYPVISSNNIVFQSYEKNLKLIELGNILNGRDLIISKVLSYIMDKPLLGYGIGSVMEITGFNYPHNFALQFLFEGGIILAMPIIYLLINSFKLMFSANVSLNDKTFIFFLFQSSVIQLSFSSYPWQSQIFWLFIGTVIKVNNNLIPTKKIA